MNRTLTLSLVLALCLNVLSCKSSSDGDDKPAVPHLNVFTGWQNIENRDSEDEIVRIARHSLVWNRAGSSFYKAKWYSTEEHPHEGQCTEFDTASLPALTSRINEIRAKNPKIKLFVEINYQAATFAASANETSQMSANGYFPDDSSYWLRDSSSNMVLIWGKDTNGNGIIDVNDSNLLYAVDFRNLALQKLIAQKALAIKNTGLFDGIFMDSWKENYSTTKGVLTATEECDARLSILQNIRDKVGDDFLIIVNANAEQVPKSAPYVNGLFMECSKPQYNQTYTLAQLIKIETTLTWAESALKTPRINCLEGWRIVNDRMADKAARVAERDLPVNLQGMRMFTAMSLSLSDGYLLFADDNQSSTSTHLHNWFSFWDCNLGKPLSDKTQTYSGIDGVYMREFENGWVVYNRSGLTQHLTFVKPVTGVNGGIKSLVQDIQDRDGEIYLK
jgi:hypothetical protein